MSARRLVVLRCLKRRKMIDAKNHTPTPAAHTSAKSAISSTHHGRSVRVEQSREPDHERGDHEREREPVDRLLDAGHERS